MGTRVLTFFLVLGLSFVLTRILHSFLSRLSILRSRIAILCTSSFENKSGEKFSIGPMFSQNSYKEPYLIPMFYSLAYLTVILLGFSISFMVLPLEVDCRESGVLEISSDPLYFLSCSKCGIIKEAMKEKAS